jgi:hypothetical protein
MGHRRKNPMSQKRDMGHPGFLFMENREVLRYAQDDNTFNLTQFFHPPLKPTRSTRVRSLRVGLNGPPGQMIGVQYLALTGSIHGGLISVECKKLPFDGE